MSWDVHGWVQRYKEAPETLSAAPPFCPERGSLVCARRPAAVSSSRKPAPAGVEGEGAGHLSVFLFLEAGLPMWLYIQVRAFNRWLFYFENRTEITSNVDFL